MSQNLKFGTQEDLAEILAAQGECSPDFRKQNADVYAGMDCLEQGKLVTGKISQVNDQEVLIDVNYKSEGVIDRRDSAHRSEAASYSTPFPAIYRDLCPVSAPLSGEL